MSLDEGIRRVDLRTGVSLSFREQGDRSEPSLVLLHAWGESMRCFERLTSLLPRSLHVVAVDQRGHGMADKPVGGYHLASLAADIEAFMDAIGLSSAVLAGSSSGGYIAQEVAVQNPDLVTGLILIGSPRSLQGQPAFADQLDLLTDPIDRAWASDFVASFPLFHHVPRWYIEDRVEEALAIPADTWRKSLAGLTQSPAPIETGTISAPTLIIWGDRDQFLARDDELALAADIAGSRFIEYEGVGHLVLWEQPERVAADITAFLQDVTHGENDHLE